MCICVCTNIPKNNLLSSGLSFCVHVVSRLTTPHGTTLEEAQVGVSDWLQQPYSAEMADKRNLPQCCSGNQELGIRSGRRAWEIAWCPGDTLLRTPPLSSRLSKGTPKGIWSCERPQISAALCWQAAWLQFLPRVYLGELTTSCLPSQQHQREITPLDLQAEFCLGIRWEGIGGGNIGPKKQKDHKPGKCHY